MYSINRFLYLIVFLFLGSCSPTMEEIDAMTKTYDVSVDVGKGVYITYSDSAAVKVVIEAPSLQKYNASMDAKEIFDEGIKVTFIGKDQKPSSYLEADYGIRDTKGRIITTRGNVRFYNTQNDKLQSHELIWDEGSGRVYTDKFIRLTRPTVGDTLYGVGFETDQDFKVLRIKRRNQGKVTF